MCGDCFMKRILTVCGICIWMFIYGISVAGKSDFENNLFSNIAVAEVTAEPVVIKDNELYSQGAVLMDAVSGRVLYGKNEDLQLAMASTTKIMTCILALEHGGLEDVVTASAYAAAQPKVKLYLTKGEQILLKDLLYSLMLESHNDSAVAIAEHIGAKLLGLSTDMESVTKRTDAESKEAVAAFIKCMNDKAGELQCYDTWFITPNGLDGTETFYSADGVQTERFHSTTAAELARIMSYCILQSPEKEAFLEITGTYSYNFTNIEKTRSFVCRNHNAFLNMMDGAISGKTGYTGRAGYCYVGALEREDRYFVVALLNSGAYGSGNKGRKWQDTKKLMSYGLEHYHIKNIYDGNTSTEPIIVENAKPEISKFYERQQVDTAVSGDKPVEMLLASWEKAEVTMKQENSLMAPVREGQIVGAVDVMLNGSVIEHFDIICTKEIEEKSFKDTLYYMIHAFMLMK